MKRASRQPWLAPLVALVVVYLLFLFLKPDTFARGANFVTMARQTTVVAIAAVGATLVIVSGGIDLSVGSLVALTTVVVARILQANHGPGVALLGGVAVAAMLGVVNGTLVARAKIPPFIVTLGTMSILRGAAKGMADEHQVYCDTHGLEALLTPPDRAWLLFPPGVWVAITVAIAAGAMLRYTRFGRHVYAVGSSESTAAMCGVGVPGVKTAVYAIAGGLAGLAGALAFSNLTVGDPTTSAGLELEVIAAVVIGGASLSGGEGTIIGTLVGAFLMEVIRTGCNHLGVHNWVQEIVTGGIIVVAAALDPVRR
jgi:ribose transport system permease protein